jgi:lysophospholipase L1-like esterase
MKITERLSVFHSACLTTGVALALCAAGPLAQQTTAPEPKNWTAAEDHQNMMDQLGIKALRPGPSGNDQAPNHANYDEATANPFPNLPEVLTSGPPAQALSLATPADRPVPRTDRNSMTAHAELLEKAKKGRIDVYFVGDSITRRWGALDYPDLLANWKANFFGWNAADFGWGADRIQNMLWRLENGELDGVNPKVIVVLAGTNNVGSQPGDDQKIEDITRGLKAILDTCRRKAPEATIILTAIFPRNDNITVMPEINRINENLARFADGRKVRYLNVNDKLADRDGRLFDGMMDERDRLHPTILGYQVWADGLKPIFTELLGAPADTDLAPPPTGDPGARGRSGDGGVLRAVEVSGSAL